jgi:hypothetical protein
MLAQTKAAIRIMETYNQSVCRNCLMQGCRGHNCDAEDWEVHEAIPDVMAVLHGIPEIQQGLLDAAADTTSGAVVAPLTLVTYFLLAGIDDHEVDSLQVSHRHQDITSCFSDEDDGSSPSGSEEVVQETRNDEDQDHEENVQEDELPLDSFFLPPLSDSRFFLRQKETGYLKSPPVEASCDEPTHGINTTSDLFWTLHNPTKEPPLRIRGAICKAFREVKDPTDPTKWVTITDHLDRCGAFDLVQRQYLHDIKPAAQYGMRPIRMSCLESITDWYRDVGKDYVKDANGRKALCLRQSTLTCRQGRSTLLPHVNDDHAH